MENESDRVIGMICISQKQLNRQVLVVSENGLGKRTPFFEKADGENPEEAGNLVEIDGEKYYLSYRITNRGGKGVKTLNVTEKTGALVGLLSVEETDDLIITCQSGVTIRMKVSQIREAGRATQGVRLINIDEGDSIAAIASLHEQEDVQEEEEGGAPEAGEGTGHNAAEATAEAMPPTEE